ncbi:glycerophosphocholine phosphodiesterase [Balamuthia mandrillaris]
MEDPGKPTAEQRTDDSKTTNMLSGLTATTTLTYDACSRRAEGEPSPLEPPTFEQEREQPQPARQCSNSNNNNMAVQDGLVAVRFRIRAEAVVQPTRSNGRIFLCGNCEQLGNWDPRQAVPLSFHPSNEDSYWMAEIKLPRDVLVEYKYCVKEDKRVRCWESLDKNMNRSVLPVGASELNVDDGSFGTKTEHKVFIDRGWMVEGFKLNIWTKVNHNDPVQLHDPEPHSIKVIPTKPHASKVKQSRHQQDRYIIYAHNLDDLSFEVEIWSSEQTSDGEARLLGKAAVLANKFSKSCCGSVTRPIMNRNLSSIGTFTCRFLLITPFLHPKNDLSMATRSSFSPASVLHIGHRGSGANRHSEKEPTFSDSSDDEDDDYYDDYEDDGSFCNPFTTGSSHSCSSSDSDESGTSSPRLSFSSTSEMEESTPPKGKGGYTIHTKTSTPINVPPQRGSYTHQKALLSASVEHERERRKITSERSIKSSSSASLLSKWPIAENTLLSFEAATKMGADYVEFDVQLTKDSVPVIVHDHLVRVPTDTRHGEQTYVKLPVNKLTLRKFQQLRRFVPQGPNYSEIIRRTIPAETRHAPGLKRTLSFGDLNHSYSKKSQPLELSDAYTTLAETFQKIPEHVGFDVEIKYPSTRALEKEYDYPDRNHVVDAILKVIFEHGGKRPVFISSFDPDICMMCSLKQPRYPVFFLTDGGTALYEDIRRNSLTQALALAKQAKLRGIVTEAEAVLKDLSFVQKAHDQGLLLFTFGDRK